MMILVTSFELVNTVIFKIHENFFNQLVLGSSPSLRTIFEKRAILK